MRCDTTRRAATLLCEDADGAQQKILDRIPSKDCIRTDKKTQCEKYVYFEKTI
jgi:hypothetical protein